MVSRERILVRKNHFLHPFQQFCETSLCSLCKPPSVILSADSKSRCFLLAGSLLPVARAGLGAFQRQVPGGNRQTGPAHVEDEAPLRPQQEQRLRGAGGEEPAGHLGPLQGLPHRPRGGQEKSVQHALNFLSVSLSAKVVVNWKSSAHGLETQRRC